MFLFLIDASSTYTGERKFGNSSHFYLSTETVFSEYFQNKFIHLPIARFFGNTLKLVLLT